MPRLYILNGLFFLGWGGLGEAVASIQSRLASGSLSHLLLAVIEFSEQSEEHIEMSGAGKFLSF
jgi:hypothetical protein